MKIQVVSDLHLEFSDWELPQVESDIIVCAGDIDTGAKGVEWAIEQSKCFNKPVIYVMGNHEYYGYDYNDLLESVKQITANTNVHVLDNDEFVFNGVRFLGTTLWTDFAVSGDATVGKIEASRFLNDYHLIKNNGKLLTPDDTEQFFVTAKTWLENKLNESVDEKTVVVTHHGMCNHSQNPQFPINHVSGCFWSDLESFFFDYDMVAWIFGHTHASVDSEINGVKVISNQRGYVTYSHVEQTNFVEDCIVEV